MYNAHIGLSRTFIPNLQGAALSLANCVRAYGDVIFPRVVDAMREGLSGLKEEAGMKDDEGKEAGMKDDEGGGGDAPTKRRRRRRGCANTEDLK